MNAVIIYKSTYGSTKEYANWIAEALKGDVYSVDEAKRLDFKKYDVIIYGGGLYASGINGIGFLKKRFDEIKDKRVIVFSVGVAELDTKEKLQPIIDKNYTEEMKKVITTYHCRGELDYSKLGFVHKIMMAGLKKVLSRKKEEELTEESRQILATYGGKIDFKNKKFIKPIVECAKKK